MPNGGPIVPDMDGGHYAHSGDPVYPHVKHKRKPRKVNKTEPLLGTLIHWTPADKKHQPNGVIVQVVRTSPIGPIIGFYVSLQGQVRVVTGKVKP